MFDAYIEQLQGSELLVPLWGVLLIWAVFASGSEVVYRRGQALSAAQSFVVLQDSPPDPREADRVIRHAIFSLLMIVAAYVIGGAGYVFIAGGWIVAAAVALGLNLHSTLFSRALTLPNAAEGTVRLSPSLVQRTKAAQLFGGGAICVCIGALVPHLALFGACVFLWATAFGYLRRARKDANL